MKLILQAVRALFRKIESRLAVLENKLVASDWNAAEGEPGHVLHRTHWAEEHADEILPETTVEIDPSEGMAVLPEPVLSLTAGNEYTVKWNGAEYKCKAQLMEDDGLTAHVLGDFEGMTGGVSTGEPFVLICSTAETAAQVGFSIMIYSLGGSTSATFSIKTGTESVHRLDGKFLPEGTPYMESFSVSLPETAGVSLGDGSFGISGSLELSEGETYTVTYNGVKYKAECQAYVNGKNFFVQSVFAFYAVSTPINGYTLAVVPLNGASSVTIAVEGTSKIPHKLEENLLPDDYSAPLAVSCTISSNTATELSHSYDEVCAAIQSGRDVILFDVSSTGNSVNVYRISKYAYGYLRFHNITFSFTGGTMTINELEWSINNEEAPTLTSKTFALTTT